MAHRDGTLRWRRVLTRPYLAARIKLGWTAAQIAADAGCSMTAVYDAVRRHNLPTWGQYRGPRPDWSDVLTHEFLVETYHDEQLTLAEIAGLVGCSPMAVQRAMARHGLPRRSPASGGAPIYEIPIGDDTDRRVAEAVGAHKTTVTRARYRAGVTRAKAPPRKMSDDDLAEVDRRVRAGEPMPAVAAAWNVPAGVMWNRIYRWRQAGQRQ